MYFVYFDQPVDIVSNLTTEIEQLKLNLGFSVDGLLVKDNKYKKKSVDAYDQERKNINIIYARHAFDFELSNSKFINNVYFSSNVLMYVGYVKINGIILDKNKSVKYKQIYMVLASYLGGR